LFDADVRSALSYELFPFLESMPTATSLLRDLNEALIRREVRHGFALLDREASRLCVLHPAEPGAGAWLLCVAQWVDLGYKDMDYLSELAAPFTGFPLAAMQLGDYLCLRMVKAYIAFLQEDSVEACEIFDLVLRVGPGVLEPHLVVVSHFWKCRAHRQRGQYELALHHIQQAKSLSLQMNAPRLVAVTNIHESWLLFQRGQRRDAMRLLDEAQAELSTTGHLLSLGNIESARGRFVRRGGEYAKALQHFEKAIQIYGEQFPDHPNLARALVNAAYVKRLIAIELLSQSGSGRAKGSDHKRFLQICHDALELLRRAGEIYRLTHHQTGIGAVLVNAAYLHLDTGDIDRAAEEARKAFDTGREKHDNILMARARTLQATIHNDHAEERLSDSDEDAHLARAYAEDAVALAKLTQNNRLLAGAYVVSGTVAASEFFRDWQAAKNFAAMATDLLSKDDLDHLSKQLGALKSRILQATGVDEILRSWSEGTVGGKSFQQVSNEFAELVIPKVWEREGRKISRVAQVLSISPKKVRRILISARGTKLD
jgi:tetratricopeptide (TPR) repeat protein